MKDLLEMTDSDQEDINSSSNNNSNINIIVNAFFALRDRSKFTSQLDIKEPKIDQQRKTFFLSFPTPPSSNESPTPVFSPSLSSSLLSSAACSVTRVGYFWTFLAIENPSKSSPNIWQLFRLLWKASLKACKSYHCYSLGNFGKHFGYFCSNIWSHCQRVTLFSRLIFLFKV